MSLHTSCGHIVFLFSGLLFPLHQFSSKSWNTALSPLLPSLQLLGWALGLPFRSLCKGPPGGSFCWKEHDFHYKWVQWDIWCCSWIFVQMTGIPILHSPCWGRPGCCEPRALRAGLPLFPEPVLAPWLLSGWEGPLPFFSLDLCFFAFPGSHLLSFPFPLSSFLLYLFPFPSFFHSLKANTY